MFKGVFTKDYTELVAVLMATSKLAKTGLSKNREKVDKTRKVYSDYRALTAAEAVLTAKKGKGGKLEEKSIPVPPQLLTETQAGVISAYIISKLLSKPKIINVPQLVNQPEISTAVDNFMVSCQNRYDWRLKLNKTIHGMTRFGPAGVMVIPRVEGIDIESITPGNGSYDVGKQEGMCILRKSYDFLMDMLDLYEDSLTGMGKKIKASPEMLHHLMQENYSMGYYEIAKAGEPEGSECTSGFSHQEKLTSFLSSVKPISKSAQGAYKGRLIHTTEDGCPLCFEDDGKMGEVDAAEKLEVMSSCYEITFNTVHLDGRLANLKSVDGAAARESGRKKYLVMSLHGFPLSVTEITSERIIISDLFLSADNEEALTLAENLQGAETYNTDYHRSIILALKSLVNQDNIWFDNDVFTTDENGRRALKSGEDFEGKKINPRDHMYAIDSPADSIAAIAQTLPRPAAVGDDITGNNPMLSAQHTKGNRTAIEGQNLTANSESRFFVYAGVFYMTVVNALAKTAIDLIDANPSWIKVYDTASDAMVTVDAAELIAYSRRYYQEQTGLIPSALGSPDVALAILNLFGTNPQISQERDIGDMVTYFAKTAGFTDFPELRRPHQRDDRLKTGAASPNLGPDGREQLATQLAIGNQDPAQPQQPQ